jgi:hypothetical protein
MTRQAKKRRHISQYSMLTIIIIKVNTPQIPPISTSLAKKSASSKSLPHPTAIRPSILSAFSKSISTSSSLTVLWPIPLRLFGCANCLAWGILFALGGGVSLNGLTGTSSTAAPKPLNGLAKKKFGGIVRARVGLVGGVRAKGLCEGFGGEGEEIRGSCAGWLFSEAANFV